MHSIGVLFGLNTVSVKIDYGACMNFVMFLHDSTALR